VRVLIDWVIELFFPRDIVQTIDISDPGSHNSQPGARKPDHGMRPATGS